MMRFWLHFGDAAFLCRFLGAGCADCVKCNLTLARYGRIYFSNIGGSWESADPDDGIHFSDRFWGFRRGVVDRFDGEAEKRAFLGTG